MYRIAVVGDYDSIYGFAALGLDTFPVNTHEEAGETLRRLAEGEYGIIYITESWAADLQHEIERYQGQVTPRLFRFRELRAIPEPEWRVLRNRWK